MTPEVELRLTADLDDASREVAGFRKEYASLVREVEKPLRQANSFREVSQSLEGTQRQIGAAKDRLRQLRDEIVRTDAPSKELQADYRNATNELKRLERQESAQIGQLRSYRSELQAAGVDVGNLAGEQRRLSAEFNKRFETGRADAALQSARNALGVGEIESAQRKLVELRSQYRLVTQDGNLSAKERKEAESTYRRSVSETLGQLRSLRAESASQATATQREAIASAQRQAQARAGIAQVVAEQKKAAVAARQTALEVARNDLGVNRAREAQASIQQLQRQYELLRARGKLTARELAIAQETLTRKIQETRQELSGVSGVQAGGFDALGDIASGVGIAAALQSYLRATDAAKKMNAQLELATDSQEEFNRAQAATFEIAQRNQAPLADVITLYSRLQPALSQLGRGQSDVLGVIDAVTKSLRISGASAAETASTIQQFAQALGSGVLRGEEFNTLAESSPRLLRALADGLKVPIGALRDMAAEGQLTADVITDTLLAQLPKLSEEAAKLPETFEGSMTKFGNQLTKTVSQLDQFTGASDNAIGSVNRFSSALSAMSGIQKPKWLDDFISAFRIAGSTQAFDAATSFLLFGFKEVKKEAQEESKVYDFREERLRRHTQELRKNREQQVKDAAAGNKQLIESLKKRIQQEVSAERAALSEIEKIKKDRAALEAKYEQVIAGFSSSTSAPSFGEASALKVSARNALQAGDIDKARSDAQAALEMLQQLQQAGQNTYGFGGFAKELLAIEDAALGLEQSNAEQKLAAIRTSLVDLRGELDGIKDVKVTVSLSDAELQAVISKVEETSARIGKPIVIPVIYAHPDGPVVPNLPAAPQDTVMTTPQVPSFATGGIARGPGTGTSDSIWARISNGEGILTAQAVQHYGASLVHQINRLQLPRFATGGVMGERYSPAIPAINPTLLQSAQSGALGTLNFHLPGGERFAVQVAGGDNWDDLHKASLKYGSPARVKR